MTDLGLNTKQLEYAATIRQVGQRMGMTERDIETAFTVVLTESGLQNYANSNVPESMRIPHDNVGRDHNSVGVFQQQVGIWGNADDLMNVGNSARLFFEALGKVPNREAMTIPQAAQTVQRSAYSDGSNYAKHVDTAKQLYAALKGGKPAPGVEAGKFTVGTGTNPLQWLTNADNWKRIGIGVLGAVLLGIVLWQFLKESDTVKAGLNMARVAVTKKP